MRNKYPSRVTGRQRRKAGSALILTVVLTSLLGIVGVMFVMMARIDNMSTSALVANKQFDHAVDSVVEKIKQVLANDVPGTINPRFPNVVVRPEYQDYPLHEADFGPDGITGDDRPIGPGPDGILGNADDWPLGPGPDGFYYTKDDLPYYPGPDGFYGTVDDTPYHPGKDGTYGTGDEILMPAFREQDPWLASLEPRVFDNGTPADFTDDIYYWPHITDLYGDYFGLMKSQFWSRYYYDPDDGSNSNEWTQGTLESLWYHAGPFNVVAKIINPSDPVDEIIIEGGSWNNQPDRLPFGSRADADGDGVADSRWVILPDFKTGKGEDVYAAVRIIDNGGMLNVNTAYRFDGTDPNFADGSNQMQVNLVALSQRSTSPPAVNKAAEDLHLMRSEYAYQPLDVGRYIKQALWKYDNHGQYTFFDISDELKLRNRYILNYNKITSRIEGLWSKAYESGPRTPLPTSSYPSINAWAYCAAFINPADPINYDAYDYRHISTTYNMDRIIDPNGSKMFGVNYRRPNDPNAQNLYDSLKTGIDPALPPALRAQVEQSYAQFAANVADFADEDTDVSVVTDLSTGSSYYGFEVQPFISELGMQIAEFPARKNAPNYYAVELYNPFDKSIELTDFLLVVGDPNDPNDPNSAEICCINLGDPNYYESPNTPATLMPGQCRVIANNPAAFVIDSDDPNNPTEKGVVAGLKFYKWVFVDPRTPGIGGGRIGPSGRYKIGRSYPVSIVRETNLLYVDRQQLPFADPRSSLVPRPKKTLYLSRNMDDWRIVYPHLAPGTAGTLGRYNAGIISDPDVYKFSLALHRQESDISTFLNSGLLTIGDVPQILTIGPRPYPPTMGELLYNTAKAEGPEHLVRLNLQDPLYANIFQYLTVFDPTGDGIDNDWDGPADEGPGVDKDGNLKTAEYKVPGRININTAPWFVIAQLPWVTPQLAQAIVAYRDMQLLIDPVTGNSIDYRNRTTATGTLPPVVLREQVGFASIGELTGVINDQSTLNPQTSGLIPYDIRRYVLGEGVHYQKSLESLPDLTPDNIKDDFEERDVIFSRISNLVTVRSDVFTAYILVRIGRDGPQRRILAILDRSDVYPPTSTPAEGKVKVRAFQRVPDPR